MKNNQILTFIERIKKEATYKKIVKVEIIHELINLFRQYNCIKLDYSKIVENPIEMALQFYKDYNIKYYKMIMDGINCKKIIINYSKSKSFIDTKNNDLFINLNGNDSDIFMIVHELAHYIDRNSIPQIIPDEYWFLSEVFSFYMERNLEFWLTNKNLENLNIIRRNNRLYYEIKMLNAIDNELYYEELYNKKGTIEEQDIDFERIKEIENYNEFNLINYLLQYPLANIISNYLIEQNIKIKDNDFVKKCLNLDLYELLKGVSNKMIFSKR